MKSRLKRLLAVALTFSMVVTSALSIFAENNISLGNATGESVTFESTTEESTTEESKVEESTTEESTTKESVSEEGTSEESTTKENISEESDKQESANESSIVPLSDKDEETSSTEATEPEEDEGDKEKNITESEKQDGEPENEKNNEKNIFDENNIATISDVENLDQTENSDVDEDDEEHRVLSFRPSEFEAPKVNIDKKSNLFGTTPLPSSYDSRNYTNDYGVNIIPSVKDQGNYGTCWAFSEIGMFESAIRKKNYVTNEADGNLSVAALAYFTLNTKNVTNNTEYMDKPGVEGHDYTAVGYSGDSFADIGGNYVEANLVASSYIGVVKEDSQTSYSNMPNIVASGLDGNYAFKRNAYELGSAYFINKKNEDLVKKAIMDYGCVGIAYEEGRTNSNCHQVDGEWCYYHSGYDINHAVLVVGWNDNIPKEYFYYAPGKCAPRNGGWLVKNSWGTNRPRMNQGYFWISYADPSIDSTIVAIDPIKADTYKYNYHYDTTGNEAICYYSNISTRNVKFGNIYKVSENEDQTLDAINIALASTNSKYKIEIYTSDNSMSNPYDGIKRLSQEDLKVSSGIYTIELDNPVSLKKGTYFSIVILPISVDGNRFRVFYDRNDHDYYRTYVNESALGQGYEDEGSGWVDFNSGYGGLSDYEGITCGINLRIKGLTNPANKINLVANNGTSETSYQAVKFGVETVLEKNPFTKEGYNFVRWRDENGNTYADETTVVFDEELTLTAEWEPITYNIIYNTSGGTLDGTSVVKTYNTSLTLPNPTRQYSTFINWYKEPTFENVYNGNSDLSTKQGDDVNIYAKWQGDIFNVSFEANGGNINSGEFSEYEYGIEKNLPTDLSPSDEDRAQNKLFYGWYDNENFSGNKITKITATDHGSKNYYARYEVVYTITYQANGGNGNMPVQYVFRCDSATLRYNSFTKSGYSFNNWSASNGSTYSNGQNIGLISGNITLKANWNKESSYSGGGSGGGGGRGGGGGGGGLPTQNLPTTLPNGQALPSTTTQETTIGIDAKNAPVNNDTANSTWIADANGNWHLQIVDANGQVSEPKNSWAAINTVVIDAFGKPQLITDMYFFDENGKMLTGWLSDNNGNKFFLENKSVNDMGKMAKGWKQVDNSWYYFNTDGTMLSNGLTPDGFMIGADGKWTS